MSATRADVNAIVCPSGDHRGALADQLSLTSGFGGDLPSVATNQIDEKRRFRARSMRDDKYATWLPSGESRGSDANTKLK